MTRKFVSEAIGLRSTNANMSEINNHKNVVKKLIAEKNESIVICSSSSQNQNYHQLMETQLSSPVSYRSNKDTSFNWKSFYFSIHLIIIFCLINTDLCMSLRPNDLNNQINHFNIINSSQSDNNFEQNQFNVSTNNRIYNSSIRTSEMSMYQEITNLLSNRNSSFYPYLIPNSHSINSTFTATTSRTKPFVALVNNDRTLTLSNLINSDQLVNSIFNRSAQQFNKFTNSESLDLICKNKSLCSNQTSDLISNKLNIISTLSNLTEESNENKMRRRFVDNEQNKGFNQEDLKKHIARTQDKMQKWEAYQTNFTTLKKQILNSTNSSYPVSRQAKSTYKQHIREDGLSGQLNQNMLGWVENKNMIAYNSVDEYDLLPDEDKPRFMSYKMFCEKCYCEGIKVGSLKCVRNNHINFIPILPYEDRVNITEILIENQEHFYELNESQLKYYSNITKLTIEKSGLREIRERTFKSTLFLKEIHIKHNKLKTLQRKLFDDLDLKELSINDNPIVCNCTIKWIGIWLNNSNHNYKFGISGHNVSCTHKSAIKLVKEYEIRGCDLPAVKLDSPNFVNNTILINEGQNFTIRCNGTGEPLPSITFSTNELRSKYNIKSVPIGTKKVLKIIEFYNTSGSDSGQFPCFGENFVGRSNATVNITILAPPRIEFMKVVPRFHKCVDYKITGNPAPTRKWYLNDQVLNFTDNLFDTIARPNKRNNYLTTGSLCLDVYSHKYNGNYTLSVQNQMNDKIYQVNDTIEVIVFDNKVEVQESPGQLKSVTEDVSYKFSYSFLIISCIAVLMIVILVAIVLLIGCNLNAKKSAMVGNKLTYQNNIPMVDNPNYLNGKQNEMLNEMLLNFKHIDSKRVMMIRKLGEGAFGRVYLGTVKDLEEKDDRTFVAVKVLKRSEHTVQQTDEFEKEAKVLLEMSHQNIVKFYGVSVDQNPFMMIFEYMKLGDLNTFLRKFREYTEPDGKAVIRTSTCQSFQQIKNSTNINNNIEHCNVNIINTINTQTYQTTIEQEDDRTTERDALINNDSSTPKISIQDKKAILEEPIIEEHHNLNVDDLYSICEQVGSGMEYLASKRFVHRDLASRNCLLTKENGTLIVKIGDFGMSRELYKNDYYKIDEQKSAVLPVRWMAPESIEKRIFTSETDVWAFGVFLWEVWTLGKQPFFELDNQDVLSEVCAGRTLKKPENCPDAV